MWVTEKKLTHQKPISAEVYWSPEKARSKRYSFEADVWAVLCTGIHLLSGNEPWMKRFPAKATLILVVSLFH